MERAYILSGSNINPLDNTLLSLQMLNNVVKICILSTPWETQAIGSCGPNFLNIAIALETEKTYNGLKEILGEIEQKLGRIRTSDKNAPRTIDLDVIIYDGKIIDDSIWKKLFIAAPMAELVPNIRNSSDGKTLREIASDLLSAGGAKQKPSLSHYFTTQCGDES
jgi:2-amino-4-hydroxy-6-hydroxymethyldihydropteridine diphosphokinase